jgi:dienelactone hydrolase
LQLALPASGGRVVPVQLSYPADGCDACRLVVFSHGAYAAPERYRRLTDAWAGAGYVVAAPMHVDSELNPTRDQYDPAATMLARLEDFALLTDSEAIRTALRDEGVVLAEGVIAAGHSYGAWIAQLAGGATLFNMDPLPDNFRAAQAAIIGVVALSPPGPVEDRILVEDWANVDQPMLVVTGTTDILPGFIDDWRLHLASFEVAQLAPAYALVFEGQDHYFNGAFGRPRDNIDAAAVAALATLNNCVADFMALVGTGRLPDADAWQSRATPTVDARVSPFTNDFLQQGEDG